ncbi:MAG TPA: ParB/RepB/Spo0J family partition protein [Ktedonobacteraceae bacterium]|nr:ParB/RepB/Spo0J family partition protein [Ktedonobacteraceae bacterium]
MSPKGKSKANYGALFNAGAALQPGAFPKLATASLVEDDDVTVQMIPSDALLDNPYQPRGFIDEETLEQLASTIQDQGFQGVLTARPHPSEPGKYQITAGHRRREAARRAGLTTIPTVVKELSDQDMAILSVTENIQREDLTPLDEGKLFCVMMDTMDMTLEQVAAAVKKSESYIRNRRRVAMAPEDIQQMIAKKPDSLRTVVYLLKIEDAAIRAPLIELIIQGQMTADQVDQHVKSMEQGTKKTRRKHSSEAASFTPQSEQDDEESLSESVLMEDEGDEVLSVPASPSDQEHTQLPIRVSVNIMQGPPTQAESYDDQRQRITRVSKLKTLLKALQTYAQVAEQDGLSPAEVSLIDRIVEIAQQIQSTTQ